MGFSHPLAIPSGYPSILTFPSPPLITPVNLSSHLLQSPPPVTPSSHPLRSHPQSAPQKRDERLCILYNLKTEGTLRRFIQIYDMFLIVPTLIISSCHCLHKETQVTPLAYPFHLI